MPDYHAIAVAAAKRNGVDPNIFVRQIAAESGFNPAPSGRDAQGRPLPNGSGAVGIAQIVGRYHPGVDATDPVASLNYAAHLMGTLYRKYGDYQQALSVYNSGRPDVYKDPRFAGGQTFNYVKTIMGGAQPAAPATAAPTNLAPAAPLAPAVVTPTSPRAGMNALLQSSLNAGNRMLGLAPLALPVIRQPVAPRMPVLPVAPTVVSPQLAQQPVAPYTGRPGRIIGATASEQPAFLNALAALAGATGKPISINSGFRSRASQQRLWDSRASNPNPVARPGSSLHERGLAADGTIGGVPIGSLPAGLLARFGLETVPGDPVHVQLRRRS